MIELALFLALVGERVVEYFIAKPLKEKLPDVPTWWLMYVGLAVGGTIAWFAGVNVFEGMIDLTILGRVLTCILVGGGTNLLNDIIDALRK